MGKSLKAKLTFGALGLVIIVCIAITAVVSFIINRQNLQTVGRDLAKALVVVETEVEERKENLAREIEQMAIENKIGASVKFFFDYLENDLSISESTYYKTANIVLNKAMAIDSLQIAVYDLKGNLQIFATREAGDMFRFGFFKSPTVHLNDVRKGEEYDEGSWQHVEGAGNIKVELAYGRNIPTEKIMYIDKREGSLCIETLIPVFANEFNDNGDPVSRQFGFIHAVKELDQSFVERLHRYTGMSINIYAGNQFSLGQLKEYRTMAEAAVSSIDKGQGEDDPAVDVLEIMLEEDKFFQAVLPTSNQTETSGSIAVLQSDDIVKTNNRQMIKILSLVSAVCLTMIIPLVLVFSRSIIRPILHIVGRMKDIAEGDGDLRGRITISARDEVGQLAESFNTFVEKIQVMVRQVKENLGTLNDSSSSLSDIASSLAAGAGQSLDKANVVATAGEEMSANMNSIAASMEQAATNVSMVSDSARQMSGNNEEVIGNTAQARSIAGQAVSQAIKASKQVEELGNAASEIEHVIETITEISEQVNLLALNATIEAARAGEAGKGFAVVANEIKELAKQTAVATNDIKKKVADIRNSTNGTVTEIEAITSVNTRINDIVTLISTKVEEQSVAINHIAENVSQASLGIGEVNENVAQSSIVSSEIAKDIVDVTQTAGEISQSSTLVNERANDLSALSAQLKTIVDRFQV